MPYKDPKKQREAWQRHYQRNRQKYYEKTRAQKQVIKNFISDFKRDKPCVDCGNTFPEYCMDFDHLGDKSFNISQMLNVGSIRLLVIEMAKCELVCSNCHRVRTWNRSH